MGIGTLHFDGRYVKFAISIFGQVTNQAAVGLGGADVVYG